MSEQDISRAQDYAHKSGYPTDKLKHNTLRLKRRTVASVYENVLDNLEASANLPAKFKAETEQQREQKYTLFDVTGDGTPELLVYGELAEDEFLKPMLTGVRLADVSERGSDRDPVRLEKFNGKHVLAAFQSYYPAFADELLDNQVSGNIQNVTLLE